MNEGRKRAYRFLLHLAMLEIRSLCQWHGEPSSDPQEIQEQYLRSRQAGALAEWQHNLAAYSQHDFQGFDEDLFWKQYDGWKRQFPDLYIYYDQAFENELKREDSRP